MMHRPSSSTWFSLFALALAASCFHGSGEFVWVKEYQERVAPGRGDLDYVINVGDTLRVSVYEQEGVSARSKVRADGRISVALVGDVTAAGRRPADVASEIATKLKQYIKDPSVTVSVEEVRPISVSIVGEVTRPGVFQLEATAGVLDALAAAGGPTEFADKERLFVLRRQPSLARVRFTYESLIHNDPSASRFTLKSGDTVVVE